MNSSNHIQIFDTTLRDGQQCPGAGMSKTANIRYAELAAELGVDVLEAGFPSASKVDFDIVKEIASSVGSSPDSPVIAGLCQLRREQVEKTIEAVMPAKAAGKAKMHVYLPVDPNLMKVSLGEERAKKTDEIIANLGEMIRLAVSEGLQVEFSPEGYTRMGDNFDFVTSLLKEAVEAGANVLNCPDTIGGSCRLQGDDYFVNHLNRHAALIDELVPGNTVTWSAHCHNDFGLAVQNTINAVFDGPCRQIEGCFNGVGERAGNASLEQCIMIIKHFSGETGLYTKAKSEKISSVCSFVSENMLPCQPHWPISGSNAFKHSSGGHTNAILKNPLAYQPFNPEEVGEKVSLIFGPLSGGNHAKSIVEEAGFECGDKDKAELAQFIKDKYSDRRKGITDEELLQGYFDYKKPIRAERFSYSKTKNKSEIKLKGKFFEIEGDYQASYQGKDSALAALKLALDERYEGCTIQSHKSKSKGEGISAISVSTIILEDANGTAHKGEGEDQDIEISAMKALINAFNKAYVFSRFHKG